MNRGTRRPLRIDIHVDGPCWRNVAKIKSMLRRAVAEAAATLPRSAPSTSDAELAIVLTDDSAIRLLNRQWRGVDTATNVLSFPAQTLRAQSLRGQPHLLGDIVLAHETIRREAAAEDKPFLHHLAHLAVHGFLHLAGYDHVRDRDAEAMQQAERKILRRLDVPDPYRDRRRGDAMRRLAR
jgi:probable rRNA maturation factor